MTEDITRWEIEILDIAREWLLWDVPRDRFPSRAVIPLENPDLYDPQPFLQHLSDVETFRTVSFGTTRGGHRVALTSSKFGAPAVAMLVHLLTAAGVSEMVGVGFCGGLDERIACGDLVLPVGAVRDDGTTPKYVAQSYPAVADFELHHRMRRSAESRGAMVHSGIVLSTDAILLETTKEMTAWARWGVIAVDMEAGALLTVSRIQRARAAVVLVASDHPVLCRRADPVTLRTGVGVAIEAAFDAWDGPA